MNCLWLFRWGMLGAVAPLALAFAGSRARSLPRDPKLDYAQCSKDMAILPMGGTVYSSDHLKLASQRLDLLLVPHAGAPFRTEDELKAGAYIGHIWNFDSGTLAELGVVGRQGEEIASITCAYVYWDAAIAQYKEIFVNRDGQTPSKVVRREKRKHLLPGAQWREESSFTDRMVNEPSIFGLKRGALAVNNREELLLILKAAWYVCDGNGCCKN